MISDFYQGCLDAILYVAFSKIRGATIFFNTSTMVRGDLRTILSEINNCYLEKQSCVMAGHSS